MTSAEWIALAERCEKATGPDREIDRLLDEAGGMIVGHEDHSDCDPDNPRRPLRFTGSLDAINALIERELPGASWSSGVVSAEAADSDNPSGAWARLFPKYSPLFYPEGDEEHERFLVEGCASEPLARSASLCRTMAALVAEAEAAA